MNWPTADVQEVRRLVMEAADKHGPMRPEPRPLTPEEQEERLKADTLLLMVTPTQGEYLRAIYDLIRSNGYPPSMQQIGIKVGRSSSSTVQGALERLKDKGMVTWVQGARRTLTLTEAGRWYVIQHPREVA